MEWFVILFLLGALIFAPRILGALVGIFGALVIGIAGLVFWGTILAAVAVIAYIVLSLAA